MHMAAATIVELYEQHIRHLSPEQQLELLALVAERLAHPAGAADQPPARSILELHGAGHSSWDGSDAQEFVNKLRDEWDERRW